jgi:hypothetical protein
MHAVRCQTKESKEEDIKANFSLFIKPTVKEQPRPHPGAEGYLYAKRLPMSLPANHSQHLFPEHALR